MGGEGKSPKIIGLENEVRIYRQMLKDAKDALASVEMELDEQIELECEAQLGRRGNG